MAKEYKMKISPRKLVSAIVIVLLLAVTAITVISYNSSERQTTQSSADERTNARPECEFDESDLGNTWYYTGETGCDWEWYNEDDASTEDSETSSEWSYQDICDYYDGYIAEDGWCYYENGDYMYEDGSWNSSQDGSTDEQGYWAEDGKYIRGDGYNWSDEDGNSYQGYVD